MSKPGLRWTVQDHEGNLIHLTEERWAHIIDPKNHPEMQDYEAHLKTTIQKGHRRQEPLNPRKYRYSYQFEDLPEGMTHVVTIVCFKLDVNARRESIPNNFIATAFFKHIRSQGEKR
jgi:hypothetical protein